MENDNGRESNAVDEAVEEFGHVGESQPWYQRGSTGWLASDEEIRNVHKTSTCTSELVSNWRKAEERGVAESRGVEQSSGSVYKEV